MSTEAERWAARQRGLSPAQERILRALAQFHTAERGCFPSQQRLSDHTRISQSSLNRNLAILESLDLIRRELRRKKCGNQATTLYHLNLDVFVNLPPKHAKRPPTPKTGVHRLPIQEPSQYEESMNSDSKGFALNGSRDTDSIARWLLSQAGRGLCAQGRAVIRTTDHVIDAWLACGFDPELDILPAVKARTRRTRRRAIETWTYFTAAIKDIHRARTGKQTESALHAKVPQADLFPMPALTPVKADPVALERSRSQNSIIQAAREDYRRQMARAKDDGAPD